MCGDSASSTSLSPSDDELRYERMAPWGASLSPGSATGG
jgi:hypothetical protein